MKVLVAGVDEAGRGPLAGAVYAAAVMLNPEMPISGLDDSKKLSEKRRVVLEHEIKLYALCWNIASASVEEIDALNILHATMLAMKRAIEGLPVSPQLVRIDGNRIPSVRVPAVSVIGGDALHDEISAASILAKQARDRSMVALAQAYPCYGFEKHKGYPTKLHLHALQEFGVTGHHRRSFGPVKKHLDL